MARPPKEIKWDTVLAKMQVGQSGVKIAFDLAIQPDTLYLRFKQEFGCSFQDYHGRSISDRNKNLEYTQYKRALEGDSKMLVWLGKCWLGQKEVSQDERAEELKRIDTKFDHIMKSLGVEMLIDQSVESNNDETISINESIS